MRSHRCQQRHHAECTIPPGSGAMFPCQCACHTSVPGFTPSPVNQVAIALPSEPIAIPINESVNPTLTTSKSCTCPGHSKPHRVFSTPIEVWAGSKSCTPVPGAIILDLADLCKAPIRVEGFELHGVTAKRVVFDWPDMQTPNLGESTWWLLADKLVELGQPIYVACMGGHGRTGTALAILGSIMGAIPDGDPVAWLRTNYCPSQVETQGQLDYVGKITGRQVKVKANHGGHTPTKAHWPEGTDLARCKYAPQHSGCAKFGHELRETTTSLPQSYTGYPSGTKYDPKTDVGAGWNQQCPQCHAYSGHFSNCPLRANGGK